MLNLNLVEEKFYRTCFRLSKEDILDFDKEDNGPINNVIAGIARHCYGVQLLDHKDHFSAEMFYINGAGELKGDIIQLKLKDTDYFALLLKFCVMLSIDYPEANALDAFNTFQQKLRGFLEKLGFFTVSSLELKQFKGKDAVMFSPSPKGIFKLDLIDQRDYYRSFFGNIAEREIMKGKEYVYLMVNTDTSLIKIGKSINPRYRERTLHSQEPSIHVIAVWCCSMAVEKQLHEKYKSKRIRGEWFRLTIPDLAKIEQFMNGITGNGNV